MIEAALTGIRLSLIALYATFFFRLMFYSWKITEQPQETREQGWRWWRWGIAMLSVSVVVFYSPSDILHTADIISSQARMMMSLAGSLLNAMCAVCLLVGLDVANGGKTRAFPFYLAVVILAIGWIVCRE